MKISREGFNSFDRGQKNINHVLGLTSVEAWKAHVSSTVKLTVDSLLEENIIEKNDVKEVKKALSFAISTHKIPVNCANYADRVLTLVHELLQNH
ncbi:MAG: hypothetical protein ACK4NC_01130 [Candidatus Gracilibacteria bacterium]